MVGGLRIHTSYNEGLHNVEDMGLRVDVSATKSSIHKVERCTPQLYGNRERERERERETV